MSTPSIADLSYRHYLAVSELSKSLEELTRAAHKALVSAGYKVDRHNISYSAKIADKSDKVGEVIDTAVGEDGTALVVHIGDGVCVSVIP